MNVQAIIADTPSCTTRGIIIYRGDRVIDLTPPDSGVELVAVPQRLL